MTHPSMAVDLIKRGAERRKAQMEAAKAVSEEIRKKAETEASRTNESGTGER